MRRVSLLLLLTGCGFQSGTASMNGGDGGGGGSDGSGSGGFDATPLCPKIVGGMLGFNASACATPTVGSIDISTSVSIDTAPGASNPPGLACAVDSATICVLVAPTITIETGAVLSAHGPRPFALFGHSITIRGTVDVASHIATGVIGAGSLQSSCIPGTLPTLSGGGRGGDAVTLGGVGGGGGGGKGLGGSVG
jgi:hypothetical protein